MKPFFVREATVVYGKSKAESPRVLAVSDDVAEFARPIIGNRLSECVLAVAVNSRHKPIAWSIISVGTSTSCIVCPADVLRFVLLTGGPGFFLVHNHPSGDPTPSAEDAQLTSTLNEAAKLLGLRMIDHVVVSEDSSYTMFLNYPELFR